MDFFDLIYGVYQDSHDRKDRRQLDYLDAIQNKLSDLCLSFHLHKMTQREYKARLALSKPCLCEEAFLRAEEFLISWVDISRVLIYIDTNKDDYSEAFLNHLRIAKESTEVQCYFSHLDIEKTHQKTQQKKYRHYPHL